MPASLARAHTGLKCMHMHMHCYCVCRRRRPGPPPYRLPPRPADRVGHRPGHACKKWTDAPTRSCMPRPCPRPGRRRRWIGAERRHRARKRTHTCLLPANISRCLPRSAAMSGRPARPACIIMHACLAGAVPCSLQAACVHDACTQTLVRATHS